MEGVLALLIPIAAVAGFFAWMIAISPLGRAYADRIRGAAREAPGERDAALVDAVEGLRRDVAELAERLDFAERLLAKPRAGDRVAPPR